MNDFENATTKIFQRAIAEILPSGQKLELFAPDYTDDMPEARALGVGFQATSMYYRAESRVSGGMGDVQRDGFPDANVGLSSKISAS